MPLVAIEAEDLGRIYKIRGIKIEKAIRRELVALADVNCSVCSVRTARVKPR
jgi:hypothetical protein